VVKKIDGVYGKKMSNEERPMTLLLCCSICFALCFCSKCGCKL